MSLFYRVKQDGAHIMLGGKNLLRALPDSDTQLLGLPLTLLLTWVLLKRPHWHRALLGGLMTLLLIYVANTIRLTVFAVGVSFPNVVGGINVMAHPWPVMVSQGSLLLAGLLPLLIWLQKLKHARLLNERKEK